MTTQANEAEPRVTLPPEVNGVTKFEDGAGIIRDQQHIGRWFAYEPGSMEPVLDGYGNPWWFKSRDAAADELSARCCGPSSRPSAPTALPPGTLDGEGLPAVEPEVGRPIKARVGSRIEAEPLPIGDDESSAPTSGDGPTVRMLGPEDSWNVPSPPRGQTPETGGHDASDDLGRSVREAFVSETDNGGPGPLLLFHVWPDGSRSLALPEHVEQYVAAAIRNAKATDRDWQQYLKACEEGAEKRRRVYYQDIVYHVCRVLDRIDGKGPGNGIVCGTAEEPSDAVQKRMDALVRQVRPTPADAPTCLRCGEPIHEEAGTAHMVYAENGKMPPSEEWGRYTYHVGCAAALRREKGVPQTAWTSPPRSSPPSPPAAEGRTDGEPYSKPQGDGHWLRKREGWRDRAFSVIHGGEDIITSEGCGHYKTVPVVNRVRPGDRWFRLVPASERDAALSSAERAKAEAAALKEERDRYKAEAEKKDVPAFLACIKERDAAEAEVQRLRADCERQRREAEEAKERAKEPGPQQRLAWQAALQGARDAGIDTDDTFVRPHPTLDRNHGEVVAAFMKHLRQRLEKAEAELFRLRSPAAEDGPANAEGLPDLHDLVRDFSQVAHVDLPAAKSIRSIFRAIYEGAEAAASPSGVSPS